MRAFAGVAEVAHGQRARDLFGAEYSDGHDVTPSASQLLAGNECPRAGDAEKEPSVSARVPRGALSGPGGNKIAARTRTSWSQCYSIGANLMTLNIAPWGSASTAKRPGGMSVGSTNAEPPSFFAFATVASVSAVEK